MNNPEYIKIDRKYGELLTENGGDEIKSIQDLYAWAIKSDISIQMVISWLSWKASH